MLAQCRLLNLQGVRDIPESPWVSYLMTLLGLVPHLPRSSLRNRLRNIQLALRPITDPR